MRLLLAIPVMAALMLAQPASAQPVPANPPAAPVVLELFTSQACSSCPPAEALLRTYAKRSDLIALEWHVDFWNSLNVPGAGRWRDPYSNPVWTTRQRDYNRNIMGKSTAYTPEAIVNGASHATGSDKQAVDRLIAAAKPRTASLTATRTPKGVSFTATGLPPGAEALLVTFRLDTADDVTGGENKGRKLASVHVVTGARKLGPGPAFVAPLPAQGEGCALIVHARNQGPILTAAYCP
jgi:hypothetical protein